MTDRPLDERRFTDEEVRKIISAAVQSPGSPAPATGEGLSLAELKSVGEEVGIDPDRLEAAARTVALAQEHRPNPLIGAPTVLNFQRSVEGVMEEEDAPEILSLIRRIMGHQGEAAEIHGSLEWSAKGEAGDRYITLSSRHGVTKVRGATNLTNMVVLTYLPAGLIGLITSLIGLIKYVQDGSLVGLVLFLTVLPILYPILRGIMGRLSGKEARRLEAAVEEVARRIEATNDGS